MIPRALACGVLAVSAALASPSYGEEDRSRALAADLFDAGLKKMDAGKCETEGTADVTLCTAARDDFRRAFSLYPGGLGALRNLAYVEKGLRMVASAARDFRELARRAPLDADPKRRMWGEFAKREADALDTRIPRITVEVARPYAPGLSVTLDGAPVPEAAWSVALDVDPGAHVLRASAPGYEPFEASWSIAEENVRAFAIALSPVTPAAGGASRAPAPAPSAVEGTARDAPSSSPRSRVLPMVVTGVGAAGVAVGLALGYVAIQKHHDACGDGNLCEPNELDTGRSFARASTIVTSAGAAVLAGGVLWYLFAPRGASSRAAMIAPCGGGAELGLCGWGRF